jgi:hypothetical protein
VGDVAEYAAPTAGQAWPEPAAALSASTDDERVWVMRRHPRVRLRQAHAIVTVDWDAGVARASCGLELDPASIGDIPVGGCAPCVLCIAATPLPT